MSNHGLFPYVGQSVLSSETALQSISGVVSPFSGFRSERILQQV